MLVDALLNASRRSPRSLAVEDETRSLTYRQLTLLSCALRAIVRRSTDCQRVGIMLPASSVFPAALMGTLWASRVAVPLNFLLNAEELAAIVRDAELDLIITVKYFRSLTEKLPAARLFLEDLPLKRGALGAMLRPLPQPPVVDPHDTAVILYTSGTTAMPKGVELTFGNLHSNCVDTIASLEIDPPQVFLNTLPPFHVFGLTGTVLVPIVLAASVVAIPRFSPLAVLRAVEKKKVTIMLAIPSMYGGMLRAKSAQPEAFRSVLLAISGGEPLPDNIRQQFEQRLGVILKQGYGLTETGPVVAASSPSQYRDGTVGKPIHHVELRIISDEGASLAPGEDGEILVRGPGVMKGYYRKPIETRQVLDEEGWFRTGDAGHLDQDGFLAITGRVKEMLIIGGENVFPREIEAVLEAHEAVQQAAVIGVPDDLRGECPIAFVIPREGATVDEAQLRNFARNALAGYKVPKRISIHHDLPTGPTGKILKRRLRDLI